MLLAAGSTRVFSTEAAGPPARTALRKMMKDGNFKEAYDGMRKLTLSAEVDPKQVGPIMREAIECLQRLNRVDEIDAYREAVIEKQHMEFAAFQGLRDVLVVIGVKKVLTGGGMTPGSRIVRAVLGLHEPD